MTMENYKHCKKQTGKRAKTNSWKQLGKSFGKKHNLMKPTQNLLFMLMLFSCFSGIAQPKNPERTSLKVPSEKAIIKGKIIDKSSDQAMEYANISVYSAKDSSLVTGGITNVNGEFRIGNINTGFFYVEANFIGFQKTRINNIKITPENKQIDLGTIPLEPSSQEIADVKVVGEKPRVEYQVDKKVINVGKDINSTGGTAVDALENTPSVQVDIEGNVTLRGSSNFTVFIDGRPSVLTGSDALQQIPSSAIENIEIITNPSAKYDPDGVAGIINVVMKKNIKSGFNGIVNAMIGTKDKQQLDMTINQKTAKRNITLGADINNRSFSGSNSSTRETYSDTDTTYLVKNGTRNFSRSGYELKAGTDLYLSDLSTLSFSANYGYYKFDGGGQSNIHQYTSPATVDTFSVEQDPSTRDGHYVNGNINFQQKFNKEGTHKLEALGYYSHRNGNDRDTENEFLADENYELTTPAKYTLHIRTNDNSKEDEYRFQVDYTKPLGTNGKLETGLQSRINRSNEDYLFEAYDDATFSWVKDNTFSSIMDFKRDIHAAYVTVSSKLGPLEYMLGARGEYTNRKTELAQLDEPYKLTRFDFFPSVHLSWNLLSNDQIMASYSRRIDRPSGRDLDPFEEYRDQYTIRTGNPDLEPEYTNSYEAGFIKRFGTSFLSLEAFSRKTNNLITHQSTLGDDGILYETTINLNHDNSLGGELMGDISFTKWLQTNSSISVYKYQIENESDGEDVLRTSTNVDGRISATVKFASDSRMQIMGMFRGPSVTSQGNRNGMFYTNASFRQDLFKKKLSATLSMQDIFGTGKYQGTSSGTNFKNSFKFKREPRILMFTLSYKINNYKVDKQSDNSSGGTNEIDYGGGESF